MLQSTLELLQSSLSQPVVPHRADYNTTSSENNNIISFHSSGLNCNTLAAFFKVSVSKVKNAAVSNASVENGMTAASALNNTTAAVSSFFEYGGTTRTTVVD
jgi:hypothetical protein